MRRALALALLIALPARAGDPAPVVWEFLQQQRQAPGSLLPAEFGSSVPFAPALLDLATLLWRLLPPSHVWWLDKPSGLKLELILTPTGLVLRL